MSALAPTLQTFFTDYMQRQRKASPHTIAAYRDAVRLLLAFTAQRTGKQPHQLDLGDLDAQLIVAFLDHIEHDRHNTIRTRNARLAAIHSLYHYAGLRHPEHAALIARVLAIPTKRAEKPIVTFLNEDELDALLAAPDRGTWTGRRDHAIILLAAQTGLRADELLKLDRGDIHLGTGAHVYCVGKGRKHRVTPLIPVTIATIKIWLAERAGAPTDPLFPTRQGRRLSHDALERRIAKHAATASRACPSLQNKKVTRTSCGAPPRFGCCKPPSTRPQSRSGSAMQATRSLRSTCTPTSPSSNARSTGPPRPAPKPDAIDQPTRSSRSSRTSNHTERTSAHVMPTSATATRTTHTASSVKSA